MSPFARYRERLEAAARVHFATRGLRTGPTGYILPRWEDWPQNLDGADAGAAIVAERERRQAAGEPFPLHEYLHHGLSSQAMLFNLLLPLLDAGDLPALAPAFTEAGCPFPGSPRARLEVSDREVFDERNAQPTSFDLVIEGDGAPVLVEAKLVETGFGGCSLVEKGNCDASNPAADHARCALHAIGRRYWTRLDELGFDLSAGPVCLLALHYQFFREAAFALYRGGHFVLLVHADNPAFRQPGGDRGIWPTLLALVPPQHRSRLHYVTLQAAADAVATTERHPWIERFRDRYALRPPAVEEAPDLEALLRALPPGAAEEIRRRWTEAGAGGQVGRSAQRMLSVLLARHGLSRGDPRWLALIEEGRRRYHAATGDTLPA